MLTGRYFHMVAAAFPKPMSPYVITRIYGTVNSASDLDNGSILDDRQQQILTIDGRLMEALHIMTINIFL